VLKRNLKKFIESQEDVEGETFPNPEAGGFTDEIDPEGDTDTSTVVEPTMAEKVARRKRVAAIKEKIARKRKVKEGLFGFGKKKEAPVEASYSELEKEIAKQINHVFNHRSMEECLAEVQFSLKELRGYDSWPDMSDDEILNDPEALDELVQTIQEDLSFSSFSEKVARRKRIAAIKEKIARKRKIASIKEKILAAKRRRVREDDEFADDMDLEGGEGPDGLTMNIQFPAGAEVPDAGDITAEAEPLFLDGGEEVDEVMESVRLRAKRRRERLSKIRKGRVTEDDSEAIGDMSDDEQDTILGDLYAEIGGDDEMITASESRTAKGRKLEAIRRKIAQLRKLEAEVKTFDDGVDMKKGTPGEGSLPTTKPKKYPESALEKAKNRMTEKLDYNALLKSGILG
jgi:hypothetical protein